MSDNITVRGFVATEIRSSTTPGGVATASFRLGATDRRYDRAASAWVDGNTNWFTVQGYRQLAGNLGCSVKKGQRVIVVGRLKMRSWEKDGRVHHDVEIDAESVGHDLMWGSANFTRSAGAGRQADAGTRAPEASDPGDGAGNRDDGGMPADGGDGDDGDAAGGGHGGDERHATVVNDETGEEEEVDQETGELKGAA
ncbi:single-stranded DNA-binding protein [Arthrobacter sp. YAF34]|uniref:single-stranded DNA-binding protein n=1 Tax=Arthrobacter sp. YAF34 TaxID=3233083 RepID=UPI003F937F67